MTMDRRGSPGDDARALWEVAQMASKRLAKAATGTRAPMPYPTDTQVIYCGDNLDKLKSMPSGMVDLIYIDPPFNSNRNYEVFWGDSKEKRAFEDRHESTLAYIDFMKPRCVELRRVLKDSGSFYYHCDWHASHYVKVMLDHLFGEDAFLNEIVWKRTPFAGSSKAKARQYPRSHDVLFFYAKGKNWTWNAPTVGYSEKYLERFKWDDDDGRGPYRKTLLKTYSQETFDRLLAENKIIHPTRKSANYSYKQYLEKSSGTTQIDDVWIDINALNPVAKERLGYPTQKPVALLDRIIKASSDPDDIVLDAFCGCGTALESAHFLERRWIGIDISPTACRVISNRLEKVCKISEARGEFQLRDMPKTVEQLRQYPHFEFENWAVNALNTIVVNGHAVPNRKKVGDMGIDGRVYLIKGAKAKVEGFDLFGKIDDWCPVQVKQTDKTGRPEIDEFQTAMRRQGRRKGFFISFGYTSGAMKEIDRIHGEQDGLEIIPLTVEEIVAEQRLFRL